MGHWEFVTTLASSLLNRQQYLSTAYFNMPRITEAIIFVFVSLGRQIDCMYIFKALGFTFSNKKEHL